MLLTELDGFLTGILVAPELVMPAEWLQSVWGSDESKAAPFDDPADVQWFADAVLARYNEIARDLNRGKLQPLFDIDERTGDVLWDYWVDGLAQAMELRSEAWKALAGSEDAGVATAASTIATLIAVAHHESELDSMQINALQGQAHVHISTAVLRLHAARLANVDCWAASIEFAGAAKMGRNEPCSCGSGKKFKRCCG